MLRLIPTLFSVDTVNALEMDTINVRPSEIEGYSVRARRTGITLPSGAIYDTVGFAPSARIPPDFWTVITIMNKGHFAAIRDRITTLVSHRGFIFATDPDTEQLYYARARLVRAANNNRNRHKLIKTHQIKLTFELFTEFEPTDVITRPNNLVQNWDFKHWTAVGGPLYHPDLWESTDPYSEFYTRDTNFKAGEYSLKLLAAPGKFSLYQDITVEPNRQYTISAWLYIVQDTGFTEGRSAMFLYPDANFTNPFKVPCPVILNRWFRLTAHQTATASGFIRIEFPMLTDTNGGPIPAFHLVDAVKCYRSVTIHTLI